MDKVQYHRASVAFAHRKYGQSVMDSIQCGEFVTKAPTQCKPIEHQQKVVPACANFTVKLLCSWRFSDVVKVSQGVQKLGRTHNQLTVLLSHRTQCIFITYRASSVFGNTLRCYRALRATQHRKVGSKSLEIQRVRTHNGVAKSW